MIKNIKFNGKSARVLVKNPKEHIQKHWMAGNFYEAHKSGLLVEIYRREKKGGTFIDIGACIGNHTLFFAEIMEGFVFAFEPHAENCIHWHENIALNQSEAYLFRHALGAEEGHCSIRTLAKNNAGMHQVSGSGSIQMRTLDSCVNRFDVIKIDVEGYNKEVLLGAKKLLAEGSGNVYIECDGAEILKETDLLMAEYGYQRANLVMNHTPTYLYEKRG